LHAALFHGSWQNQQEAVNIHAQEQGSESLLTNFVSASTTRIELANQTPISMRLLLRLLQALEPVEKFISKPLTTVNLLP
jgi:hypothetical protein